MLEKVLDNIYQIKIPLPNNPLRELNSYLIKSRDKSLLIDTGFNVEESRKSLISSLEKLNIDFNKLDILITHLHADHSGQVYLFKETSPKIYASSKDGKAVNSMASGEQWKKLDKFIPLFDMDGQLSHKDNPGYRYSSSSEIDFEILEEGDLLSYGGYNFIVLNMPGHTRGMINLYEPNYKIYISGDHILDSITPNVSFWGFEEDDLANYLKSLGKVRNFDIDLILPSHRNIMSDHPRRVDEIIEHHMYRLEEVLKIFEKVDEKMTVKDVASKMKWEIRDDDWKDFPPAQKWFSLNEAMSHLVYLHNKGLIEANFEGDVIYFNR